ncbi:MAG: hypothetical protein JOY74_07270 [Sinobacteraceae bacterium]|nr:hypothetical protein [Nevskiaceae bacterium]MBV9317981.1 hypothetical protein [Gammaproteobacteria bacterium]
MRGSYLLLAWTLLCSPLARGDPWQYELLLMPSAQAVGTFNRDAPVTEIRDEVVQVDTLFTVQRGPFKLFGEYIMTPILLYSQMALEEVPAGGELADCLKRVIVAAHRARSLVLRILTFSREMDSQQPTLFPLRAPVEEALALLREIVPADIEIVFVDGGNAMPVLGDASLVHQVVINLCTNAYEAMGGRGGKLTVRLGAVQDPPDGQLAPGLYHLLEVSDTGHGMEPAVLAHIFEPFFTTREVGEGTGLGLSVVHGIVTSMGGAISVRSRPGAGTTLAVLLPVAATAQAHTPVLGARAEA